MFKDAIRVVISHELHGMFYLCNVKCDRKFVQ